MRPGSSRYATEETKGMCQIETAGRTLEDAEMRRVILEQLNFRIEHDELNVRYMQTAAEIIQNIQDAFYLRA